MNEIYEKLKYEKELINKIIQLPFYIIVSTSYGDVSYVSNESTYRFVNRKKFIFYHSCVTGNQGDNNCQYYGVSEVDFDIEQYFRDEDYHFQVNAIYGTEEIIGRLLKTIYKHHNSISSLVINGEVYNIDERIRIYEEYLNELNLGGCKC